MPLERRTISTLDTDTAPEVVQNGRAAAMLNVQPERGYVRTLRGSVALPRAPLPGGRNVVLDAVSLPGSGGGVAWLVWNEQGLHSVVRQLPPAAPTVLLTWAGLNLPAPTPAAYLAPSVIEDFLFYLDADGESRSLPLTRLAVGEFTPARLAAEPLALHVVKAPPMQRLDVLRTGLIGDARASVNQQAWQFTYRWQYADGEQTVLAPYSNWLDVLEDPAKATVDSIFLAQQNPTPPGVQQIDVLARTIDDEGWRIVKTLRRDATGILRVSLFFKGLTEGGVVQGDNANRPYESLWPSKAQAAVRNRLWVAHSRVGYKTPEPAFVAEVASTTEQSTTQGLTLHENCAYRVVIQFYDAFGRAGGCSQAVTVTTPARAFGDVSFRYLKVTLTTTGAAALNAEIPSWATSYSFLVSPNDRTDHFIQGRAADVLAYMGQEVKASSDGVAVEKMQLVNPRTVKHQQCAADIGNFTAVGLGYVFQPGDVLRLLNEGREYPIQEQRGDYLIYNDAGYPEKSVDGARNIAQTRIEIYSPRTTQTLVYYERGARYAVARTVVDGVEQRGYETREAVLWGDCFLAVLPFPLIDRPADDDLNGVYKPPTVKRYRDEPAPPPAFESMVPAYRLAPSRTTTTRTTSNGFLARLAANNPALSSMLGIGTSTAVNTAARPATALRWLDMSYGGRPAVQIPLPLQQVTLTDSFSFSGQRVAGALLNGLSVWQASDTQALAREQGPIRALASADDVQSEDQNLVAVCEQGAVSIGINVARVRQSSGGEITADTSQVVGYINSLGGRFGTRHPRTVRAHGGRLYWWSGDQAEFCRYAKDGVNGLNSLHECRALGQELAAGYGAATVSAAYDSFSKEYVVCFGADPGGAPARTVRYSDRAGGFVGDASYTPEALVGTENRRLLSFASGQAAAHTDAAPRLSFGAVAYPAEVSAWCNAASSVSKTYLALEVESSPELWLLIRAETPSGQYTYVPGTRMERLEDRWHGALLLDATSPGFTGTDAARRALYEGVPVQGLALRLSLRCVSTAPSVRLNAVGIEYFINGGQTPPQ